MAKTKRSRKRRCPSCGLAFLKGRLVLRIMPSGPTRQTVCQACAKLAIPVLASDAPARCEQCGTNLARFCGGCIGELLEEQTGLTIVDALAKGKGRRKRRRKAKAKPEDWKA